MLIEFPCPTCGGPALTLSGEVSCPLCGNQDAPPEAVQQVEKALAPPPPPPASIDVPNLIEFDVDSGEEWSENDISFALEYLLGFVETYEGLPDVEWGDGEKRLYFSPSSGQADAIADLCSLHSVSPETVLKTAAAIYVAREKDE
jgi:hypothetical protein